MHRVIPVFDIVTQVSTINRTIVSSCAGFQVKMYPAVPPIPKKSYMAEKGISRPRQGWRTKDARGRTVTQLDPVTLHVWHRHDVIDAETLHEIVEELEPGTASLRRRMTVIIPGTVVVMAVGIATLYHFSDPGARRDLVSTLTNPAIMAPNLVCCLFVPWFVARQARLKRVRFAMLKYRRCPHCGYDLRLLPTDPEDGATVCPECGCAWLIDDMALSKSLAATAANAGQTEAQKRILIAVALLLGVLAFIGALVTFWM